MLLKWPKIRPPATGRRHCFRALLLHPFRCNYTAESALGPSSIPSNNGIIALYPPPQFPGRTFDPPPMTAPPPKAIAPSPFTPTGSFATYWAALARVLGAISRVGVGEPPDALTATTSAASLPAKTWDISSQKKKKKR